MPPPLDTLPNFCGNPVTCKQLDLIKNTVVRYSNLSRTEIAATLCEFLEWIRPNGKPKTVECREYLDQLEEMGLIGLPGKRQQRKKREAVSIQKIQHNQTPIIGSLEQTGPFNMVLVTTPEERNLWRSLVEQHHYLGHKIPFGAHLRYLIHSPQGVVGCLQYSSPARRLKPRDQWIGWNDSQRKERLQQVVCNSRFLILPWVRIPNLASHILSRSAREMATDWQSAYGTEPLLLETMVDPARFRGTCYRAANWISVGESSGRGRNDRDHQRHGEEPKQIWLFPLKKGCQRELCTGKHAHSSAQQGRAA